MKKGLNHKEIAEAYYLFDSFEQLMFNANKEQRLHLAKYVVHKVKPLVKKVKE